MAFENLAPSEVVVKCHIILCALCKKSHHLVLLGLKTPLGSSAQKSFCVPSK